MAASSLRARTRRDAGTPTATTSEDRCSPPNPRQWINNPGDPEKSLADTSGLDPADVYQVLRFDDRPVAGANTFVTYGLSRYVFPVHGSKDKKTRMELVISANNNVVGASVAYVLMTMANAILRNREVPYQGEVIDWHVLVYENPAFQHLYFTEPVLLGKSFAVFGNADPAIRFAWLIPVTATEARRIRGGEDVSAALRQRPTTVLAYDQRDEPLL